MISREDVVASISAGAGGFVSSFALYPIEIVKNRYQAELKEGKTNNKLGGERATTTEGGASNADPSLRSIVRKTFERQGIAGFYRGVEKGSFQSALEKCLYYLVFTKLQRVWRRVGGRDPSWVALLVLGYVAEWSHMALTMPMDVALNTTDIFNRCLELIKTDTTETENCIFPTTGTPDTGCLTITEIITSTSDKPYYSNPFNEYLSTGFQFVSQALADVENTQSVLWSCGVAFPFICAFVYIFFLYFCAWPLVWGTIIGYVLVHGFVSFWLWVQSGYINVDWLENSVVFSSSSDSTAVNATATGDQVDGNTQSTDDFYLALAILCSIAYAVGICIVASVFTQIRIAVNIIKEASKAIYKIPSLLLYPIFSVGAICLLILYFFTVGIYLATMDDVTVVDLAGDVGLPCDGLNCTTSLNYTEIVAGCAASVPTCPDASSGCAGCSTSETDAFLVSYMTNASNNGHFTCTSAEIDAQVYGSWNCGVGFVEGDTTLNTLLFWFHLFSFLWTLNFVEAIGICVIAGAVCQWYWILPSKGGGKKMPSRFPVLSAVTRVYRFHLGSMAYGSAIVAIVQIIRTIMAYIDRKTKDIQAKNCVVRYLMKVVHCLLWCFEKCVKFITKNAYIYVAMRGYSFCKAARNAFYALVHNMRQFAVTYAITSIFMLLGKVMITLFCGFMAYLWLEYDEDYAEGQEKELYLPVFPVIVASVIAYFAADNFLNVYELAISSVLLCFCEDYKMHIGTGKEHMAFMSDSLRAAVTNSKVMTTEDVKEAIAKGAHVKDVKSGAAASKVDVELNAL
eukprot:g4198.t1